MSSPVVNSTTEINNRFLQIQIQFCSHTMKNLKNLVNLYKNTSGLPIQNPKINKEYLQC